MCDSCSSPDRFSGVFSDYQSYEKGVEYGWRLKSYLMEPGVPQVDSLRIHNASATFARAHFKSMMSGLLTAERPAVSFFFPGGVDDNQLVLNGRPYPGEALCVMPQGGQVDMILPKGSLVYSFCVATEWLGSLGYGWLVDLLQDGTCVLPLRTQEADAIRRRLLQVTARLQGGQATAEISCWMNHLFETDLLPLVARVVSHKLPIISDGACRQDHEHLHQLLGYIADHLDRTLTVDFLADWRGISSRYVQQLFRRYVGITPKKYVRSARLNEVRRHLVQLVPRRGAVTEVASRYGFDHLGQFSRDYKKLFGELPNETLARPA